MNRHVPKAAKLAKALGDYFGAPRAATGALALEQRIAFDAAFVATVAQEAMADGAPPPQEAHDAPPLEAPDMCAAAAVLAAQDALAPVELATPALEPVAPAPTEHNVAAAEAAKDSALPLAPDLPVDADPARDAVLATDLAPSAPLAADSSEVVFIDGAVEDVAGILNALPPDARVVMLDASRDGMDQIAEYLAGQHDITAIHIISHGSEGSLALGTGTLDLASMSGRYTQDLATIRGALSDSADILVYGCDFAEGADGAAAVAELSRLTGADVAASLNKTGAADLGGDWTLEDQFGAIDTRTISAYAWNGVLDVTVSNGKGALLSATGNNIYSIDIATGKATLITTVPATVGGVAMSGVINSFAVDQTNGLIYYCDTALVSTNTSLFAYDFINNQHILITNNLPSFGGAVGATGLGGAGATFANGKLYLGAENVVGATDRIYVVSFNAGGKTISSVANLSATLPNFDWGDIGYDPINNVLLSLDTPGAQRLDINTGAPIGTFLTVPAGSGLQGSQDQLGNFYLIGTNITQIDPTTGALIGTQVTITTNGTTALGASNDAGGWTPPTATIGNYVFRDPNANAVMDGGETGVANVTVQLYTDINNDGLINGSDSLIGADTTDASGHYQFNGVLPNNYIVTINDANNVLTGYMYTTAGGATNATADVTLIGATLANINFGVVQPAPVVDLNSTPTPSVTGSSTSTSNLATGGGFGTTAQAGAPAGWTEGATTAAGGLA